MGDIWYFDNADLYEVLCPHKLKEFAKNHFEEFGKGDFIYFKEDPSTTIYLVSKGKVRIINYTDTGEEMVKSVLSKGEIFGEMALMGETERKDFAVCATGKTSICRINVDDLQHLMRNHNKINLKIYKIIGLRLRKIERKLEAMLFKDVRSRLIDFLRDLVEERLDGPITHPPVELENHFTQKDIADLIGARRETVTAMLNSMKDEGLLEYGRKSIVIRCPEILKVPGKE
ncbi:cyclic nucleotide-binding protein [Fulvitalea axinellae]|uniref:Cyclic nucleotide-binding protein n=1 Tax=Fulvitalea axinellae TaxID=1182444 RepID=A0AAU9CK60_9BACT|nr:cyclic nucleotide-binding protein [Fulvitalea axinellae]